MFAFPGLSPEHAVVLPADDVAPASGRVRVGHDPEAAAVKTATAPALIQ